MAQFKKKILVVDDEPAITRLLKLNLEQTKEYEVLVENAPNHAFCAARDFQPDLILLDVLMPGLDGGELAAQFKSSPQFAKVPIVFLTAAATKGEVTTHHGQIGGMPFLAKPVEMSEVMTCLRGYLGCCSGEQAPSEAGGQKLADGEAVQAGKGR